MDHDLKRPLAEALLMMSRALALTVIAGALLVSGCQRGRDANGGPPEVALVMKTLNSPFFIEMQRGAQEAADRLGVHLVVQAAEREVDVEKQMQIIENLVVTGVDALLVTPSGSREIVPAIAKANEANIPVVVVDTRVDAAAAAEAGIRVASFIGSDNVEGGRVAGRHLVKVTGGDARVAILEGIPGHETGDSRLRGFHESVADTPGIEIVASQTANWERDQGMNVLQNLLQAHPEIDAVFACNDMMALGAIEAVRAAGRSGQIRIIGFDAVEDARRAIQAGDMEASVAQRPHEMGRLAVESAVKLIGGESVPPEQQVPIELVNRGAQVTKDGEE
jgi:ribose transport system substrate-binding protein